MTSTYRRVFAWVDAGFTTEEIGPALLTRLRALHAVAGVLLFASPLYLVQLFALELWFAFAVLCVAVIGAPVSLAVARTGRIALAGHMLTLNLLVCISAALSTAGGLRHPGSA